MFDCLFSMGGNKADSLGTIQLNIENIVQAGQRGILVLFEITYLGLYL